MLIERANSGLHSYLFDILVKIKALEGNPKVLDIGCGTGAWLSRIKSLGIERLVGVDYEQPLPVDGLSLKQVDINIAKPDEIGQFDFVSCIEVIEHIENVGLLLDFINVTLGVDGKALITTPNIESLRSRLRAFANGEIPSFDVKSDPTHINPILHGSLEKMLRKRGLKILHTYNYPAEKTDTMMFSRSVNSTANLLRLFLPDRLYGDNTIYIIERA